MVSCWDLEPTWPTLLPQNLESLKNTTGRSTQISADGFTLDYPGGEEPRVPHRSTRTSREVAFTTGAPLPGWPNDADLIGLWHQLGGQEMVLTVAQTSGPFALYLATGGGPWSSVVNLGSQINESPYASANPTLTEDGAELLFTRADGPIWSFASARLRRLHSARRDPPVTPGAPFDYQGVVEIAPMGSLSEEMLCPVLSPDGQHLFFASTYPDITNSASNAASIRVWLTHRVGGGWATAIPVTSLDTPIKHTCPMSVTADGCDLTFKRFSYPANPIFDTALWVARRGP